MQDRERSRELLERATAGPVKRAPRALMIYAHADDETIALGGRIAGLTDALLVHVTDGAPRNEQDSRAYGFATPADYRAARFAELDSALSIAGASSLRRECLNIPDQQTSFRMVQLTQCILDLLTRERPQVVFTHPYEGGHPDHDACAFAVHAAVNTLQPEVRPVLLEAAGYHAGPDGIETGTFLPDGDADLTVEYRLSPEQRARKEAMLHCFTTQAETLRYFTADVERFRVAPQYDFTQPPHAGRLFYDNFCWGMTSERWRSLAREAVHAMTQKVAA